MSNYVFPRWTNKIRGWLATILVVVPAFFALTIALGASAKTLNVGYAPEQPVEFSHALHAGELGMDCRYCHTTVADSSFAAVPPAETCMNCHRSIHAESAKLIDVRESAATGKAIPWVKVHNLPDYAYFDHSAHVNRGVGCVSCHGRIDQMERVTQVAPLSMSWCLDCHRDPTPHLRPLDRITDMDWKPAGDRREAGRRIAELLGVRPRTDCSVCHR